MALTRTGGCDCGAVRYVAELEAPRVQVCHCGQCRRFASGPLMLLDRTNAVEWTGAENIGVYRSSAWGERGFCKTCGSTLYWRSRTTGRHELSAGTLDDCSGLVMEEQVFIDAKPDFYAFVQHTATVTEAEMIRRREAREAAT